MNILSSCVVLSAAFLLYWVCIHTRSFDSLPVAQGEELRERFIGQKRTESTKDLWIPDKEERIHISLYSEESDLLLKMDGKKLEAEELLKNVICSQGENKITATEGLYSYRAQQMRLRNLHAHLHLVSSTQSEPPEQKNPDSAGCFDIHTPIRQIDLSAAFAELSPEKSKATESVVIKTDSALLAQGDTLTYFPNTHLFVLSACDPNYCFFSKTNEWFALADRCHYQFKKGKMVFESTSPRKILVWHESEERGLSAEKLEVGLHPREFEAFGEMHCTLSGEERTLLKNSFPNKKTHTHKDLPCPF